MYANGGLSRAERELAGSGIELVKLEKNAPDAAVHWLVERLQHDPRLADVASYDEGGNRATAIRVPPLRFTRRMSLPCTVWNTICRRCST